MKLLLAALMASFFMPVHAITYLDPVMEIAPEILTAAAEDHDAVVLVAVKDCKIYGLKTIGIKHVEGAKILVATIINHGNPKQLPLEFFKAAEKQLDIKIVFRQKVVKNESSFCPWNDVIDIWSPESPYRPISETSKPKAKLFNA